MSIALWPSSATRKPGAVLHSLNDICDPARWLKGWKPESSVAASTTRGGRAPAAEPVFRRFARKGTAQVTLAEAHQELHAK